MVRATPPTRLEYFINSVYRAWILRPDRRRENEVTLGRVDILLGDIQYVNIHLECRTLNSEQYFFFFF